MSDTKFFATVLCALYWTYLNLNFEMQIISTEDKITNTTIMLIDAMHLETSFRLVDNKLNLPYNRPTFLMDLFLTQQFAKPFSSRLIKNILFLLFTLIFIDDDNSGIRWGDSRHFRSDGTPQSISQFQLKFLSAINVFGPCWFSGTSLAEHLAQRDAFA